MTVISGCTERTTNVLAYPPESIQIYTGDALQKLHELKQAGIMVDCVVTSPPYFKKRTYGDSSQELGREPSVADYIAPLVDVFDAVPLPPWGNIWVNIGDTRGKHGELLNVPHKLVEGMQERGFLLIDQVVWAKEAVNMDGTACGHCMFEPANGRLNGNGFEFFFRFAKNKNEAWSDTAAVRIPRQNAPDKRYLPEWLMSCHTSEEGRNLSNVWLLPMGQTRINHYAVFPPALIERPIAMSCPLEITDQGPKRRKVVSQQYDEGRPRRGVGKYSRPADEIKSKSGRHDTGRPYVSRKPVTVGWEPDLPAIRRGIVLDPFAGTGTTGVVALKLGRHFIGIELYPEYAQIAEERCREAAELRARYDNGSEHGLSDGSECPEDLTGSSCDLDCATLEQSDDEPQDSCRL